METFVVRVFVPAGQEHVPFAGTVEHVRAGRSSSFRGVAELVDAVLKNYPPGSYLARRGATTAPQRL